ncbi:hypothetical protein G6F22_014715 [Rhizopus arrhizus]|nr:hypothetical protein G6F22_014715 [Rhizopus arrhizus]
MLADDLGYPFVELNREIERVAGCSILEIHNLYGPNAYRRYERRALEEAVQIYPEMVLATPGGLVSEPATLNLLLAHCYTVWLRATPEEHMGRVMAQGDFRPMSGNNEAMADLKRILAGREAFYAKADLTWVTSNLEVQESFAGLRTQYFSCPGRAYEETHYEQHHQPGRFSDAARALPPLAPDVRRPGRHAGHGCGGRRRPAPRLQAEAELLRPGRGHRIA